MPTEIERKFLVKPAQWRSPNPGVFYSQGYLTTNQGLTVRVRIAGAQAFLTIKGPTQNYSRLEFEYPIPLADAQIMLDTLCDRPLIEKIRYQVQHQGLIWSIDEFKGDNAGLMIAEVELTTENQLVELPDWVGEEVSHDTKYYNASLVKYPYSQW
ncbi:MAG: CYTH domain-containing protein [Gloeocapsa sp. DLM2.Bin57]|nr:MAG: CYTH domain-containing protein [Gloeocapsa sp. DLM2.Bin57]